MADDKEITKSKSKKLQYLPTSPLGEDLFDSNSHTHTAEALVNILQEDTFQVIGLEGVWGSGKSNVIEMVKKKLAKDKYYILDYDVWGHQEDDSKKSILYELSYMLETEIFPQGEGDQGKRKKWKEKEDLLLARTKRTTTRVSPQLGIGFIVSFLSIALVPILESITEDMETCERTLIRSIPLGVVILFFLWNWRKLKDYQKAFQKIFEIYEKENIERTTQETINESVPSVRDFREWMKDIDKDLEGKKLVLVFDNFDRLPKEKIQALWSSLHLFFAEEKYNNIKVIIPFDRKNIEKAFCYLNKGQDRDSNIKVNYASEYIQKTFDITLRVAPLIMSNWKSFFTKKWKEAIGATSNKDFCNVLKIFETFDNQITPRRIITFINEIITISRINAEVPYEYIALFIRYRKEILENPLKAIVNSDYLSSLSSLYEGNEDFQRYITSLVYQIDPNSSVETIYRTQLKNSLITKNQEVFVDISKTDAFHSILQPTILDIPKEQLSNAIETLDSINKESVINKEEIDSIWEDIYHKFKNSKLSTLEIPLTSKILLKNIDSLKQKEYIHNLLNQLLNLDNFNAEQYVEIVDNLDQFIDEKKLGCNIWDTLSNKSIEPSEFIHFVEQTKSKYQKYKLSCDEKSLDKYLSELSLEQVLQIGFFDFLKSNKFELFAISLEKYIQAEKANKEHIIQLFKIYKLVKSNIDIKILLNDNEIISLFDQTDPLDDFYPDLLAMRLSRGQEFPPHDPIDNILNQENEDIVKKVAKVQEYYINYDDFLLNSVEYNKPLYQSVVREITHNKLNENSCDVYKLLPKFESICKTNNLDSKLFMEVLNQGKRGEDNLMLPLLTTLSPYYFEQCKNHPEISLARESLEKIQGYFTDLKNDTWVKVFSNVNDPKFQILKVIDFSKWNSFSRDALETVLIEMIDKGDIDTTKKLSEVVIKSFEENRRGLNNLFKNIRDHFISTNAMNVEFFKIYWPWLIKYGSLTKKKDDVLRTVIKTELLDNNDTVELLLESYGMLKILLTKENSQDLVQAIKDRCDKEKIYNLAKVLNIKINEDKKLEKE